MPINFPDAPTTGDTYTVGDKTWTYDGTSWNVVVGVSSSHGDIAGLADDDHTQYLLADGTRTATELTVSGDLTVDTSTLHVDSTNDRVGIGTTSPTTKADIYTDAAAGVPYPLYLSAKNSSGTKKDYVQIGYGIEQGAAGIESGGLRVKTLQSGSVANALTFTGHASAQEWNVYTQGSSRLKIDSSGRVTTPNQPAFMAHRPTNTPDQSMSGGENVLAFNGTSQNVGGHYNTSNYRFTAPVSGFYWFSCNARIDSMSATGYYRLCIRKNGTTAHNEPNPHVIVGGVGVATNYESFTTSGLQYLSSGDYVEAIFANQGSVSGGLQHESTFSGFLVG